MQGCRSRGGGAFWQISYGTPGFGRLVNPISTRRADYARYITIVAPSGFLDLPTAL